MSLVIVPRRRPIYLKRHLTRSADCRSFQPAREFAKVMFNLLAGHGQFR
jgi:hypothetical protein